MTGNHPSPFEEAIGRFIEGLRRRDAEDFRVTTLEHLKASIANLQARQHSQRRLQNLNRLEPFLEAIEQYGKVVSTFYRDTNIVAFIWGPLKFLLQTTSIVDTAFSEVLNAYENLGDALPLLEQYRDLFRNQRHMSRNLEKIYDDILEFQRIILRYFQQPLWQKVFAESWKTCKFRFSGIIRNIAQLRSLIESQATPAQVEQFQEIMQQSQRVEDGQLNEQDSQRNRDVLTWLRPPKVHEDHDIFVTKRASYPATGQWLLANTLFEEWFDPRFPTIPPLLWLSGIPGAGKTMLASMVVQKARELKPAPTVLYFYCKHDDPERNNFVALGRSLLSQFLSHDNELLPTFYQKFCRSGDAALSSPGMVEELLTLAFGNCKSAYIILDGLDECPRDQRKIITQWFRHLIENLSNSEPERLRCLFVSQDDGFARKDFAGLANVKIRAEDSQQDIEKYCQVEAENLLASHPSLTKEKVDWIARSVAHSVEGMLHPPHACEATQPVGSTN
ncbi:hypothetical protein KJ359_002988 [Pestalotiopsis sp. 9143b]|nr:hypothetical protein KJ359_002988 [Pestalotiopsis sp. 9143b]